MTWFLKVYKYSQYFLLILITIFVIGFIFFVAFLPVSNFQDFKKLGNVPSEIIVYTGGDNRILMARNLYQTMHGNKLYITGMNPNNDVKTYLSSIGISNYEASCCVITDQSAASTKDNVKITKDWIKKYNLKNPIIVTSSYHLPRAQILLNKENIESSCYAVGFSKDYFSLRNWQIIITEYIKFIVVVLTNINDVSWPNCVGTHLVNQRISHG